MRDPEAGQAKGKEDIVVGGNLRASRGGKGWVAESIPSSFITLEAPDLVHFCGQFYFSRELLHPSFSSLPPYVCLFVCVCFMSVSLLVCWAIFTSSFSHVRLSLSHLERIFF